MSLINRKISLLGVLLIILMVFSTMGCKSFSEEGQMLSQAEEAEDRGDFVAVLILAGEAIAIDPEYENAVGMFSKYYPNAMENLINDSERVKATADSNKFYNDQLVIYYNQLEQLQITLTKMPTVIMSKKHKVNLMITPPDTNFHSLLAEAKDGAAEAHYQEGASMLPGTGVDEKLNILQEFIAVLQFSDPYKDTRDLGAELCYQMGDIYRENGELDDILAAIETYNSTLTWVNGYKDVNRKIEEAHYTAGRIFEEKGTLEQYNTAVAHYRLAGNYSDAKARVEVAEVNEYIKDMSSSSNGASGSLTTSGGSGNASKIVESNLQKENPLSSRVEIASEFDEMTLFDPGSDVIYIGSIIDGASIADGTYRPIAAERAPVTFSIDLANINGDASVSVEDPSRLSNVQSGINNLLRQGVTGQVPANAVFHYNQVKSSEYFDLSVGVGYGYGAFDMETSVDYNSYSEKSRTLIKFTQKYYTLNMDVPQKPIDLFNNEEGNVISRDIFGSTVPYYVSTVYYGRVAYFFIESTYSSEEIVKAFSAALEVGPHSGSLDIENTQKFSNSETTIKSRVLGGKSKGTDITNIDGIMNFIREGMDISEDLALAKPIGYKLRSLNDNSIARIVKTTETVIPTMATLVISLDSLTASYGSDHLKLQGYMWAKKGRASDDFPGIADVNKSNVDGWYQIMNTGKESFFDCGDKPASYTFSPGSNTLRFPITSANDVIHIAGRFRDLDENFLSNDYQDTARLRREFTAGEFIHNSGAAAELLSQGIMFEGQGLRVIANLSYFFE